jgi:hypothetical protein
VLRKIASKTACQVLLTGSGPSKRFMRSGKGLVRLTDTGFREIKGEYYSCVTEYVFDGTTTTIYGTSRTGKTKYCISIESVLYE